LLLLPYGFTALLNYRELEGETLEDRAARLFFLHVGERVTAQVINVRLEKKPRIQLSEQSLQRRMIIDKLRGKILPGRIADIASAGVFVSLGEDMRGFLAISDMVGETWEQRFARRSTLSVGDSLTVRVTAVQRQRRGNDERLDIYLSELVATDKAQETSGLS